MAGSPATGSVLVVAFAACKPGSGCDNVAAAFASVPIIVASVASALVSLSLPAAAASVASALVSLSLPAAAADCGGAGASRLNC